MPWNMDARLLDCGSDWCGWKDTLGWGSAAGCSLRWGLAIDSCLMCWIMRYCFNNVAAKVLVLGATHVCDVLHGQGVVHLWVVTADGRKLWKITIPRNTYNTEKTLKSIWINILVELLLWIFCCYVQFIHSSWLYHVEIYIAMLFCSFKWELKYAIRAPSTVLDSWDFSLNPEKLYSVCLSSSACLCLWQTSSESFGKPTCCVFRCEECRGVF